MSSLNYSFEDEQAFRALSWKWARACDTKNADFLHSFCAPNIRYNYAFLHAALSDEIISSEEYVKRVFAKTGLGDERVKTQHILGAVVFKVLDASLVTGDWQCQAMHVRDMGNGEKKKWVGHAYVKHYYEKIDGEFLFAGVEPNTLLVDSEGSLGEVFEEMSKGV